MSSLYISEYIAAVSGVPLAREPALVDQKVTFTGTAGQSTAFNGGTSLVRLMADADCHVLFGANPTATNAKAKLMSGVEYWRAVEPGQKVSAIATS